MYYDVELLLPVEQAKDEAHILRAIQRILHSRGVDCHTCDIRYHVLKSSLDARRRVAKQFMRCRVTIVVAGDETTSQHASDPIDSMLSAWHIARDEHTVVVVGAGPAGLFAALRLLVSGIRPIVVDRGPRSEQRVAALDQIKAGHISEACNICWGEGGAGTFSDGKLFTTSGRGSDKVRFLATLVHFGADPAILTEAHPHIGSDKLPAIVSSIRSHIEALGGQFLFDTQVVGFLTCNTRAGKVVCGVEVRSAQGVSEISSQAVIVATGHAASDVYHLLLREAPQCLVTKGFAMGVRVEHPRELIDSIQYGDKINRSHLTDAARYKLAFQVKARGVYTFCMCPGGFVVPAATSSNSVVVNGMSFADRASKWSNAAFVVQIDPSDISEYYVSQAIELGSPALAGLLWRQKLESDAFATAQAALSNTNGGTTHHQPTSIAPAQRMVDFIAHKASTSLPETSYTPGVVSVDLHTLLPPHIAERLYVGLIKACDTMPGFNCHDALLIAPETQTSSPVRVLRDKATLQCAGLGRLYPAGEGSGWSGGITSSALDGQRVASEVAKLLLGE